MQNYAHSIQVPRIEHSLSLLLKQRHFALVISAKCSFWCEASCHFPQDSKVAAETGRRYQKTTWKEHSSPRHKQYVCICSKKVGQMCCLVWNRFIAVYILFPALICSFLACPWHVGGIITVVKCLKWCETFHCKLGLWKKGFFLNWFGFLYNIIQWGKVLTLGKEKFRGN